MIAVVEKEAGKFNESADAFAKAGPQNKQRSCKLCGSIDRLASGKARRRRYPQIVSDAITSVEPQHERYGIGDGRLKKEHGSALDMKIVSAAVKAALT